MCSLGIEEEWPERLPEWERLYNEWSARNGYPWNLFHQYEIGHDEYRIVAINVNGYVKGSK